MISEHAKDFSDEALRAFCQMKKGVCSLDTAWGVYLAIKDLAAQDGLQVLSLCIIVASSGASQRAEIWQDARCELVRRGVRYD